MKTTAAQILLVDDDCDIAEFLAMLLAEMGHQVVTAGNGRAAIDALQKQEFDLIIADYAMPKIDGLALLAEVNLMGALVPLVFVTGRGTKELAMKALREGAYDFIEKPVTEVVFKERIAKAIAFGQALRNLSTALFSIGDMGLSQQDKRQALERIAKSLEAYEDL